MIHPVGVVFLHYLIKPRSDAVIETIIVVVLNINTRFFSSNPLR